MDNRTQNKDGVLCPATYVLSLGFKTFCAWHSSPFIPLNPFISLGGSQKSERPLKCMHFQGNTFLCVEESLANSMPNPISLPTNDAKEDYCLLNCMQEKSLKLNVDLVRVILCLWAHEINRYSSLAAR